MNGVKYITEAKELGLTSALLCAALMVAAEHAEPAAV